MIKITNGITEMLVSIGAYKDIYKSQGYKPVSGIVSEASSRPTETPAGSVVKFTSPDPENVSEDNSDVSEDKPSPEPESLPADLSEIPLGEMNSDQLRAYAKELGVDLKGLTSKRAVREKIRAAL